MKTACLAEAMYLLERAMRTRGLEPVIGKRTFCVRTHESRWSMSFLPGNRRTLVFHDVYLEPELRGQGIGKKLLKLREELAREVGATLLLATVRNDNVVEDHLLRSNAWLPLMVNNLTGVSLWGKQLC